MIKFIKFLLLILLLFASIRNIYAVCGDGHIDPGEQCDGGALNGQSGYCCSVSCTIPCTTSTSSTPTSLTITPGDVSTSWYAYVSSCSSTYLEWVDYTSSSSDPCFNHINYTVTNAFQFPFGPSVFFPSELTSSVCTMWFVTTSICNTNILFIPPTYTTAPQMQIIRQGSCGTGTIQPGEQCDIAGNNGQPGSCCSSSCQFNPFTIGTPTTANIQNCVAASLPISDWFPSPSVSSTYWSYVNISSTNCTGTLSVVGNATGSISFTPPIAPEICVVNLTLTTTCSSTISSIRTIIRNCCGDGSISGTEQCDLGNTTNGALGSCCSSTCTLNTFDSALPSTATVQNCPSTALVPVSDWYPSSTVNYTQFATSSILTDLCIGSIIITGGGDGFVNFPLQTSIESCTIALSVTDICGQNLQRSRSITRICCGDGIVSPPEQCDLGFSLNAPTSCCSSNCTSRAFTATSPSDQTIYNALPNSISSLNWFISPSVTETYWLSTVLNPSNCSGISLASSSPGTNVLFNSIVSNLTCNVGLNTTDLCGNVVSNAGNVNRILEPTPPNPLNFEAISETPYSVCLYWLSQGGFTAGFQVSYQLGWTAPPDCNTGTIIGNISSSISTITVFNLLPLTNYSFRLCSYNNNPTSLLSLGVTASNTTISDICFNKTNGTICGMNETICYTGDKCYNQQCVQGTSSPSSVQCFNETDCLNPSFCFLGMCPAATPKADGTICINQTSCASQSVCSSGICPAPVNQPNTTVCVPCTLCTKPSLCNGLGTCNPVVNEPDGTSCFTETNCIFGSSCLSGVCPTPINKPPTTVCFNGTSCINPSYCNAGSCPSPVNKPDNTDCGASTFECLSDNICFSGNCFAGAPLPPTTQCGPVISACSFGGLCSGVNSSCIFAVHFSPAGTLCGPNQTSISCFTQRACDNNGICLPALPQPYGYPCSIGTEYQGYCNNFSDCVIFQNNSNNPNQTKLIDIFFSNTLLTDNLFFLFLLLLILPSFTTFMYWIFY